MIDELVLRYVDADDLGAALLAGQVDLIAEVTTEAEAELRAATDIEVVSGAQPVIDDIIFNLADEAICPPERGDLFRSSGAARSQRAACHGPRNRQATDHRRDLNGLGTPGLTLIPDSLGSWFNDSIEDYVYDIAVADQILDEAGYLDSDGDGVRGTPDGAQPLIFRLNWEGEAGEPDTMGDLLSETWGQIGIQLEPEALDFDSLVAVCCPSFDFDLILWGWGSDLDPGFLLSVMTTDAIATGMSETGYSNPEYDALFAEQAVTLDPGKRRRLVLAYARDCPQRHRLPRAPLC